MSHIQGDTQGLLRDLQVKKRQKKLREIRKRKRPLTVFTPFELKTAKRMRLENNADADVEKHDYEPLWLQVQKSF